jgi:hypothetical protein
MTVQAFHVEVKLHGFRRTQDGVVVSFVVSPIDMPQALALDPLGTRYMLALCAIGDDENPINPRGGPEPQSIINRDEGPALSPSSGRGDAGGRTAGSIPATGAKDRRSWDELSPSQQAGILCSDVAFQNFVAEKAGILPSRCDESDAAAWLRHWLGVDSRKSIAGNPVAIAKLGEIRAYFLEWAGRVPVAAR